VIGKFEVSPTLLVTALSNWPIARRSARLLTMSATEIIKELPKLTEAERRAVRQVLLDLANRDEDVALCNQSAAEGAMMFDRMEDEDDRRKSR
jgi:hypothetical protein